VEFREQLDGHVGLPLGHVFSRRTAWNSDRLGLDLKRAEADPDRTSRLVSVDPLTSSTIGSAADVHYWHLADTMPVFGDVCFRG
jgi:hypothetical protein